MKKYVIIFSILLICTNTFSQKVTIDFYKFKLNGLSFFSSKNEILKQFGDPLEIIEPKYECGFHSENEQGNKYFQLVYPNIIFIGNDKEKYIFEKILFDSTSTIDFSYDDFELNFSTKIELLNKIFGNSISENISEKDNTNTTFFIWSYNSDDAINLKFKNGTLVRFSYWSPC